MTEFVVYSGFFHNDTDILVMTKKNEEKVLSKYFNDPAGRDINTYTREEVSDDVAVIGFSTEISVI